MAHATRSDFDLPTGELTRVGELVTQRLQSRGVLVHNQDSVEDLGDIMESVEQFEAAVEARGGDLMMDEPPSGKRAQPDNPAFVLPTRSAHESAHAFISRVDSATAQLRAR